MTSLNADVVLFLASFKGRLQLYLFLIKIAWLAGGQKSMGEARNRVPEVSRKLVTMCTARCRIWRDKQNREL